MQWSYLDLWRETQHERLPTRFTYLKGSSMELLTLKPTSKIDFGLSTAHLQHGFKGLENFSELLMEFTSNSCSSRCLRASIYRLGAQMTVRQNKPRHRPDGGHGSSGWTTVRQDFPKKSRRNLSCIRTSSGRDGLMSKRTHVHWK